MQKADEVEGLENPKASVLSMKFCSRVGEH